MSELRPVLLLLVPADWEAVPEGLTELRRCLAEDYGASLMLRMASRPLRSPFHHYAGYWPHWERQHAKLDLPPRIERAFYSLDWLELDEVS